jgi:hypothetical protein
MTDVAMPAQFAAIQNLMGKLTEAVNDPEAGSQYDIYSIMDNILAAESEEEVFTRQEAGSTASKDYINRPFTLLAENITWRKTAAAYLEQGAFPFYAMCRVHDVNEEEEVVLNGGGASFVAVLSKLQDFGALDGKRQFMLVEKPVASGNTVILVKPVGKVPTARAAARSAKG